jgi:hypothetical protein
LPTGRLIREILQREYCASHVRDQLAIRPDVERPMGRIVLPNLENMPAHLQRIDELIFGHAQHRDDREPRRWLRLMPDQGVRYREQDKNDDRHNDFVGSSREFISGRTWPPLP